MDPWMWPIIAIWGVVFAVWAWGITGRFLLRWVFPAWWVRRERARYERMGKSPAYYTLVGFGMHVSPETGEMVVRQIHTGLFRTEWATAEDVLIARTVFSGQLRAEWGATIKWPPVAEEMAR